MPLARRALLKSAAAAAPLLLLPSRGRGQSSARPPVDQFVLVDALHTHTLETKGFSYFPVPPEMPDSWKAPHDFYAGTLQIRLEVIAKPGDRPVNYQLCVFQDRRSSDKHS
jgi:hypothetical protein